MADPVDLDLVGDAVRAPDETAADAARTRLGDRVPAAADGADRLGRLGDLATWWAGVRGRPDAPPARQAVHVGATTAPAPARTAGGVRRVALDPPTDVEESLHWGLGTADDLADAGTDLLVLTVAADPLHARVAAAELLGLDPVEAAGWPRQRDLTDEEWMDEVEALRDLQRLVRGLRGNPTALLLALGSAPVAAATALLARATARRTPVLLDGLGAGCVALVARRTARISAEWWQVAQRDADPLAERLLVSLDLDPLTALGVRADDGTAALAAIAVLDVAAGLLGSGDAAVPS